MLYALLLLLLPHSPVAEQSTDVLERNRVVSEGVRGGVVVTLDQWGGLEWCEDDLHWQWWTTADATLERRGDHYVLTFTEHDVIRQIRANCAVDVWSVKDREIQDRHAFPKVERRGLLKSPPPGGWRR